MVAMLSLVASSLRSWISKKQPTTTTGPQQGENCVSANCRLSVCVVQTRRSHESCSTRRAGCSIRRTGRRERMYELSCCGCSLKIFRKGGDRSSVSEVPNPDKSKSVSTPFCSGISPGDISESQCPHVSRQEWAQLNRHDCPPAAPSLLVLQSRGGANLHSYPFVVPHAWSGTSPR